jgi:hypothetical protein
MGRRAGLMPPTANFKSFGGSWFRENHNTNTGGRGNPVDGSGVKQHGSGPVWFDTGISHLPSSSPRRKQASALIAKIPFPLAHWIAQVYKPAEREKMASGEETAGCVPAGNDI